MWRRAVIRLAGWAIASTWVEAAALAPSAMPSTLPVADARIEMKSGDCRTIVQMNRDHLIVLDPNGALGYRLCAFPHTDRDGQPVGWITDEGQLVFAGPVRSVAGAFTPEGGESFHVVSTTEDQAMVAWTCRGVTVSGWVPWPLGGPRGSSLRPESLPPTPDVLPGRPSATERAMAHLATGRRFPPADGSGSAPGWPASPGVRLDLHPSSEAGASDGFGERSPSTVSEMLVAAAPGEPGIVRRFGVYGLAMIGVGGVLALVGRGLGLAVGRWASRFASQARRWTSRARGVELLAGHVDRTLLLELVQLIHQSRKSGELRVTGAHSPEPYRLLIRDGEITGAEANGIRGDEAVSTIFDVSEGAFSFVSSLPSAATCRVSRGTMELLLTAGAATV